MSKNTSALFEHLLNATSDTTKVKIESSSTQMQAREGMYRAEYGCPSKPKHHEFRQEMVCELATDDSPVVEEAVCSVDDLPPGSKKEVELRGRKILLINDNGNYLAVNGLCTHYDFALVKGTYSNGKIQCPAHGACFDAATGDIEDYPGFDCLHPFEVVRAGNELHIKTTEKRLSSNRRTRRFWISRFTTDHPIVVVGSGPAGESVVENLRLNGCKTPILMLTKESIPPFDKVLLTKMMDIEPVRLRTDDYYKENGVEVKCNSEVVSIDHMARTVRLMDSSTYRYSKLVLALGGKVRQLPNKGGDLKGVHTIRESEDGKTIYAESKGKHVVCVGASFIGMEAASALVSIASTVDVICSSTEPLPAFPTDIGAAVRKLFATRGISVHVNVRLDYLEGDQDGHVKEVILGDGRRFPADVVVVGIGVDPATTWLKEIVELDGRGFIKVNHNFGTNLPDVYAVGDAVTATLPFWNLETINIQHFQTAQKHGQLAAYSILGQPQPGIVVPYFWCLLFMEKSIKLAGCTQGFDDTLTRGDVDAFDFVKYFIKKDRVVAISACGSRNTAAQFLTMCNRNRTLTRADVEGNPTDDWNDELNAF